jgi:DNA-binding winged helix-turn-helix (wHTH) protein
MWRRASPALDHQPPHAYYHSKDANAVAGKSKSFRHRVGGQYFREATCGAARPPWIGGLLVKVRFSGCTLDARTRQLTRDGVEVHLSPKAFDLLVLLLERRPAVVPKAELRERLWPGVHVVDASLTNLIAEIRGALERSEGPAPLRTVHRVGYAFSGEAEDVDATRTEDLARGAQFWVVWKDRAIVLAAGDNVIGRDASSAVWIDDDSVSRRHAHIRVPSGEAQRSAILEDLSSTNGTYLRGRRVSQAETLANGDRIRVGTVTLVFRIRQDADAPTKRVRSTARGGRL